MRLAVMHTPLSSFSRAAAARVALLLALVVAASASQAAFVVDTGTPNNQVTGSYVLDAADAYAGQVVLGQAVQLSAISAHVLGTSPGERFTLALYSNSAQNLPGLLLYSGTATVAGDGWNGLNGLSNFSLAAGSYWVGIEVGPNDTLGGSSITGALLDRGAPLPLLRTAFDAGGGYVATAQPLSFGLRIDAAAVPEPAAWALFGAGLLALTLGRRHAAAGMQTGLPR
jgi:hypothetical protein